jgi:DNA mismatch endonuclease, patch repair protein
MIDLPSPPPASTPAVRRVMQGNRRRDTRPEIALRSAVHRLGLRYRVDAKLPLPGLRRRADLTFTRAKVAVFLDGCFWHSCPSHGTAPGINSGYWTAKLARNTMRDSDTDRRLAEAGWTSIRVWEHEDAAEAARSIAAVVSARR